MRKIEQEMNAALRGGVPWHRANTAVEWHLTPDETDYADVMLHGNRIATYIPSARELHLSDAGWATVTTNSRLNALLTEFAPDYRIFHRLGTQYIQDQTESKAWDGGWKVLSPTTTN